MKESNFPKVLRLVVGKAINKTQFPWLLVQLLLPTLQAFPNSFLILFQ